MRKRRLTGQTANQYARQQDAREQTHRHHRGQRSSTIVIIISFIIIIVVVVIVIIRPPSSFLWLKVTCIVQHEEKIE